MLRSKKARHSYFRYCGYGCCGPRIGKKRERRLLKRAERRSWKQETRDA